MTKSAFTSKMYKEIFTTSTFIVFEKVHFLEKILSRPLYIYFLKEFQCGKDYVFEELLCFFGKKIQIFMKKEENIYFKNIFQCKKKKSILKTQFFGFFFK